MTESEKQVVYTFPKPNGEEIHFAICKFKNKYYVDLRVWYRSEDSTALRPTQKGVCLPMDLLPELERGVKRLVKSVESLRMPSTLKD